MAPSKTQHQRRRISWVLLVPALLLAACSSSTTATSEEPSSTTTPPSSTTSTVATTTTEATTTTTAAPEVETSDAATPARSQLDWLVSVLSSGEEPTIAEIETHFSPLFLAEIPAEQLVVVFPQVATLADLPITVESFEEDAGGLAGQAVLVGADGRRISADVVVGDTPPNLIDRVLFQPLGFEAVGDAAALDARLANFGSQSSLGVYRVDGEECVAEHEIRANEQVVLGSVFKLWILAALATEIDAGRASWDETITVTDELRSNPAGEIYELPTGAEVTLEELAGAMIAVSDNTATDLLLDRLGRPTVEATMAEIGIADPAANVPFLSTGNLWALKYYPDGPDAEDYRALDEAGRRALLAELDGAVAPWIGVDDPVDFVLSSTNTNEVPVGEPRDLDIEWFATPVDVCRMFVHLDELATTPGLEPVATILEENPGGGIPFDRDRWPTIRYKAGSEAGVLAGAWWFEGENGERYVVAGGVSDPESAIDESAILTIASAIELVG